MASQLREVALDDVVRALRGAKSSVLLASPYLSRHVGGLLAEASRAAPVKDLRLITALSDQAIESGFLDAGALRCLAESGYEIRSLRDMHAKKVIVDHRFALVGSGNLTAGGLNGGNVELGVLLRPKASREAADRFDAWWGSTSPISDRRLAAAEQRNPKHPLRGPARGFGGLHGNAPGRELRDYLRRQESGGGYWLKLLHHRDGHDRHGWWDDLDWVSDLHRLRGGQPVGRPSYRIGDRLVLCLVGGQGCPGIIEVIAEPRYDPDRVEREGNRGDGDRWGWLTEVRPIARVSLENAPRLNQIGVAPTSVRQHGRIRLSGRQYRSARRRMRAT